MSNNDPKNTGSDERTNQDETTGDEPKVIVDESLLDAAADQDTNAAQAPEGEVAETQPMEAAPDMTPPSPQGNGDTVGDTTAEEEFFIPRSENKGLKYVGLGAVVLGILALVAFLGNGLVTGPTDASNTDRTTTSAPNEPAISEPAPGTSDGNPPSTSGSVTVTAPAIDRFDLSGCTRANLTIEANGTWVFRNCARPVLPSRSGE